MLQCRDCSLESYITGLHITGGAGVGGGRGGEGGGGGGGGEVKVYIYMFIIYVDIYLSYYLRQLYSSVPLFHSSVTPPPELLHHPGSAYIF